jgi:hypothetical protein
MAFEKGRGLPSSVSVKANDEYSVEFGISYGDGSFSRLAECAIRDYVSDQLSQHRFFVFHERSRRADFMPAVKLQIAGFDISRSGVSKIEARHSYVRSR